MRVLSERDFAGEFGRRLRHAILVWQLQRGDKLTQVEIATVVARTLKLPAPLSHATVSRWVSGTSVPDARTIAAIARTLNVNEGWLAFGTTGGNSPEMWSDTAPLLAPAGKKGPKREGSARAKQS